MSIGICYEKKITKRVKKWLGRPFFTRQNELNMEDLQDIYLGIASQSPMQNVDMLGCRRRRAYDLQTLLGRPVDFQCIGQNGPPCTVRIGDSVNFTATFNTGIST